MNPAALENGQGIALRAKGQLQEAIAVFERALAQHPTVIELALNLAQTRYDAGDNDGAITGFLNALAIDGQNVAANLALWELYQIKAEPERARAHQHAALLKQRLFSSFAAHEKRRVLVLCTPGDWQANIPVDFLFDRNTTTVHKLYLLDGEHLANEHIPTYDAAWNTIAESPSAGPVLELAAQFLRTQQRPALNHASNVLATGRMSLVDTLASVDCTVAPIVELHNSALEAQPFDFPIVVRPIGSHAGHGLEKLDDVSAFDAYRERAGAERYFVSPFVDYRNDDGFYRKYRIVFVDGEPFPVHLAISPRWMIHYYNAEMAQNEWMRNEEARFLEDFRHAFNEAQGAVLRDIAGAVGLEYFGIDCAIGRDGRVLVFEADPAMLVHSSDPIELYPYKHEFIPRVYRAVELMIDRRKAADI